MADSCRGHCAARRRRRSARSSSSTRCFPRRGRILLGPSFLASWLTIELAPWWLLLEIVAAVAFVAGGALDETRGQVGLALVVASCAALVVMIVAARQTTLQVSDALADLELDPDHSPAPFPRSQVVLPVLMRHRSGVTHVRNITFAEGDTDKGKQVQLRLDVTKPIDAAPGDRRPGVLQIHGGGWVIGDKREQGIPLLNHLAANGWVGDQRQLPAVARASATPTISSTASGRSPGGVSTPTSTAATPTSSA